MSVILAVESSCDETSVAIVKNRNILSNVIASQIKLHEKYGGVVPELASRQHLEMINPCIDKALEDSGVSWADIDAIAATVTPGLVGSLIVGVTAAKTLAMVHNKPFLGIHHLEGHIYASYLNDPDLEPPFLCLLVSGGHTSLIQVKSSGIYENIGSTRDDAVGEAFDKVARLLGLPYPGGPVIDTLAKSGNPKAFKLPEGRVSLPNNQGFHPYDSSFSGLKTAMLRLITKLKEENGDDNLPIADLCASFQFTVAKALTKRSIRACLDLNLTKIAVGGGVAANSGLRQHLQEEGEKHNLQIFFPPLKLCTDNAAMIACAACDHFNHHWRSPLSLGVASRMNIEQVRKLYQETTI
ncbi:tRNA (adenosine(37)-N6)-threonylcarbamoyltransferase complex transferase subunit TsaD [Geminocystis sp. GBBB08]|uniref:tRNA (adenosine(37)-N6)-threonylcarbamoyltransferase complex transferase subunit TsaD n=1 Tax=Geminocystis sp. GBBB08 TaxID=2604140 RepID=UPI0027E2981A|nr:tRNA (adenosine(37)-N6)-threonylcarbamoyltransferase complex transferase subunit TsaD [Geminocystis sp. GBBB08]MBL1211139.1 tRNA (adenosine(37)-N6)-threonylcarbamoyltransferase complex transferase subunit TsaD [Geminocystis sp. GBBB08]